MRSDSNIGHYDLHDRLFLNSSDRRCRFWRLHDPAFDRSSWLRYGYLFSLQHLAASWLSEFLTELRNDRCIFTLHSDCAVCLMVACGDIPAQDFHQRFCSRISFGILTLDSGSARCARWYFSETNRSSGIFAADCLRICVVFVKMWFFCALLALEACEC